MDITAAVRQGRDTEVGAYLASVPRAKVDQSLLDYAIEAGQLAIFESLAAHLRPISLRTTRSESLWGRALANSDPRYIAALITNGAYASVIRLADRVGREFADASPQALRYLIENGYTVGLQTAFGISCGRRRARHLLMVFPDNYFYGIDPETLTKVIAFMMVNAPERIDKILIQNDYAALLRYLFKHGQDRDGEVIFYLIPELFGTCVAGPLPQWWHDGEHFRKDVRADLLYLGHSIINSPV